MYIYNIYIYIYICNWKLKKQKHRCFMFPKMHKPENPGRPVISPLNCHTTSISQYVDHHLKSHVKKLISYLKDSTDFIKKINNLARSLKIAF